MVLLIILLATLVAGIGSVWLAALLSFGALARFTQHMLSLAAGALLSTAFLHLLPEALESTAGAQNLFAALLAGLVFFFLLDKAELWHHGHEHHDRSKEPGEDEHAHSQVHPNIPAEDRHAHQHSHAPQSGGWAILAGDSVHAFGDGILIASAFVADMRLGLVATLAVLVHEVPHHMGDLIVLRRQNANNRRIAVIKVSLAGSVTALGGAVGYGLVDQLIDFLPFFLVIAASSFMYVALADLIPQLQKRATLQETAAQIAWLGIGIALVMVVSRLVHGH